jgi:dihydrodipicolinate synthase/N-acetylneuraminate lyase
MKSLFPLHGIVSVLNTPFLENGKVDFHSLVANIKEALDAGVKGFLVPAMASEVYKLSYRERLELIETTMVTVGGKVPVFAGLGSVDVALAKAMLKDCLAAGCRHALFQIPYKNPDQFKSHFFQLANLQPEVIMLQDWDETGYGLPEQLIMELFDQVDAFRCLKVEVMPAGVKYSKMLTLTRGMLHISGGWAVTQMMEGLRRGIHAFMPTGMYYIYTQIYHDYSSGKINQAHDLFYKILPVLAFSNQHLDISIHFFKRLMKTKKIFKTELVREPSLEFDGIHQEIADEYIRRIIRIEKEIRKKRRG